jgi:hypothetical protein
MPDQSFRDVFEMHVGKVSDKWDCYLDCYGKILDPLRDQPVTLLEIGIQNGGSLDIWASYFAQAEAIMGVDIDPKCGALTFDDARISTFIGDAKAPETRDEIARRLSHCDIIIDDGSHVSSDIIATFLRLVPLLKDNGIYIVEDMHTTYWKELGGELFAPYSAAAFFKALTDVINQEHWSLDKPAADLLQPFADQVDVSLPMADLERIESVTFLNSLCIIRKTSGERASLGERRLVGSASDVEPFREFPTNAFARKSELGSPEDYFFAWQDRPPIEQLGIALASKVAVEEELSQAKQAIAGLEADLARLQEAEAVLLQELAAESAARTAQERELGEERSVKAQLAGQLAEALAHKAALEQELHASRQLRLAERNVDDL